MAKKIEILFGWVILIGVIVGFGIGILWARPTEAEVNKFVTTEIQPVPADVLNSQVAQKIKTLERNGAVPVEVAPGDIGRANPFAPF